MDTLNSLPASYYCHFMDTETSEVKRAPTVLLTSEHANYNGFGEFRLGSSSIIPSIAKWLCNAKLLLSLK